MMGQNVSRDEALEEMAAIAAEHYPHPVFGCECMLKTIESTGTVAVLTGTWEQHIAELMLEAAKGF